MTASTARPSHLKAITPSQGGLRAEALLSLMVERGHPAEPVYGPRHHDDTGDETGTTPQGGEER